MTDYATKIRANAFEYIDRLTKKQTAAEKEVASLKRELVSYRDVCKDLQSDKKLHMATIQENYTTIADLRRQINNQQANGSNVFDPTSTSDHVCEIPNCKGKHKKRVRFDGDGANGNEVIKSEYRLQMPLYYK
jgi:predicted  nucleic acid-binding Zn-ribbon protein